MISKIASVVAIVLAVCVVATTASSTNCGISVDDRNAGIAFKFASAFMILNSTLYNAANPDGYLQYPLQNITGNIAYEPTIKSVKSFYVDGKRYIAPDYALSGNVSVDYGSSNSGTFTAYTGAYIVTPDVDSNGIPSCDEGLVCHYIYLSTSTTLARAGTVGCRRYIWYDTPAGSDAKLRLYITGAADLYWARNSNYEIVNPPASCQAVAELVARPGAWVSNGQTNTVYDLKVSNVGAAIVTGATVEFTFPAGTSISSSWNLNQVSGNTYSIPTNGGLAVGSSSNVAGAIIAGSGTPVVSIHSTCN